MNIHPTAIVHPGARLGQNVTIGPFCVIDDLVELGDNVTLGPHVTVYRYTTVGAGTTLHANVVLGDWPQDMAFKNEPSYVRIGANCRFREGVTIHRGTKPETATVVGDNCFLMVNSHLGHNVTLGANVIIANGALLAGYVEVGERVFISGNCLLHQFIRVGRLAMLSGGCAISKDIPPFCTAHGLRDNTIVGLNIVGLRRSGLQPEDRRELKQLFNVLYRSGLNVSQAVERIRREFSSDVAKEFGEFVGASKRGICKFEGAVDADNEAAPAE